MVWRSANSAPDKSNDGMSSQVFQSIYPYTQELLAEYPLMDDAHLDRAIGEASKAFDLWKRYSFSQRATVLRQVAMIMRRDLESLAALITREMGKIIGEARGEVEKCAVTAEYYAERSADFLKDEKVDAGYSTGFVTYQPIGVVLGIMPWNFPFWQVFRYVSPTLMAGNTTLLKHAPNVCGCAIALEKIFLEAGAPRGVFASILVETTAVGKILSSDIIQGVTLTGSESFGAVK